MARDDETSALELHIKVNGQNLSAISEKRNVSTLRPPSDPSWPKIPLRRLSNNINDIIEPPCVVTLIGTPRKGRSIVRPVSCQYTRPKLNQKYEVLTHIPKRLPGSIDPRFKRQISRQKAEKPESCDTKNSKQTSDLHVSQKIEKPEDRLQGAIENADNYACYNADKLLESVTNKETTNCLTKEQFISETDHCKAASQYVTNERHEDRLSQIQKQETGRSLLLMVDEKKILPINALNIETAASSDVQPLQCYSMQIPVVAYHNIPLQISNISRQMHDKENVNSSISLNQDIANDTLLDESHYEKFNTIDNANIEEADGSSSNTARRLKTIEQKYNIDNLYTIKRCGIERKTLSETEISKTSLQEQKLIYHDKDKRVDLNKFPTNIMNNKMLKSDIAFNEIKNKELKRKIAPIKLSRKAKSFFRKKSRLAIIDSDCTLILPGSRHVKGTQYERSHLKVSQLLHRRNRINGTKSTIRMKSNNAKSSRQINSCSLTNLQPKGDLFEGSSIPLETQKLLNQSYWEYYWKLRRKIASTNKTGDKECLPEFQTLQQCSVLSCMINTALRDSTAVDGRSSSDPTFNARKNIRHETSGEFAKKTKRKKIRASKQLIGLRIIALFGITIYVAIIFLPMIYDYFFDEEYENVDTNYIELALQYVTSSFGEVFDGIIDILNTLLLRPRPCGKCNNVI